MLPPPAPVSETLQKPESKEETSGKVLQTERPTTSSALSIFDQSKTEISEAPTPLAAMLPSKYQGIDVKTLFPDFSIEKV